jgi:hypothetical protein
MYYLLFYNHALLFNTGFINSQNIKKYREEE